MHQNTEYKEIYICHKDKNTEYMDINKIYEHKNTEYIMFVHNTWAYDKDVYINGRIHCSMYVCTEYMDNIEAFM
jgi:hypothetical protein